jgi:hypothetical protein
VNLLNNTLSFIFKYRMVFNSSVVIQMVIIIGIILASTIVPIVVAVNRIAAEPDLKLEE